VIASPLEPRAVVFDLDGVLIDSEPLWQQAEVEVFRRLGVPLDRKMCATTRGRRIDEVVAHWYRRHPWRGLEPEAVERRIVNRLVELVRGTGEALPGVVEALDFLQARGVLLAVASSSSYRIVRAALGRLGIGGRFPVVHSAEDEARGKPHPDVYLGAARKVGLEPEQCLAVEDSLPGARSAKAAGMVCLAIPDPGPSSPAAQELATVADWIIPSLLAFPGAWERLTASSPASPAANRPGDGR
jgi:HAD superfamily hydrolase (TIGR01509 family)